MPLRRWQQSRELIRIARRMAHEGLVVGTGGNLSARGGGLVRITPSSLPYEEMRPSDLVTVTLDGELVAGRQRPSRELRAHLAIYRQRPDVEAIVHTHSIRATAWSGLNRRLDTGTEELECEIGGPVEVVPALPAGSAELAPAVAAALGGRAAVLLARHGVIGVGPTLTRALEACRAVERQAEIAWLLQARAPGPGPSTQSAPLGGGRQGSPVPSAAGPAGS